MTPTDTTRADDHAQRAGYRTLSRFVRPYRLPLAVVLALMLAQSAATLVNPYLAGKFAFALLHHGALTVLIAAWLALIVVQAALTYLVSVRTAVVGAHLAADAGSQVFDHVQSLPLRWHQDRPHGDVLTLLLHDVDFLANFVTGTLVPLLPLLLTCAGALILMARIEPWFALAAAILIPAVYIAMRLSGRRLRPLGKAATDAWVARSAAVEQSFAMLPLVKAFTGETTESRRFADRVRTLRDVDIRLARGNALIAPAVRVASAAAILLLLWAASLEIAQGRLRPDQLVSLLFYGLLLTQPVSSLAAVYGQAHSAHAVAQRLTRALAEPAESGGNFVPGNVRGEIAFERVEFAHADRPPVLRGIDLHLAPGEAVAITGVNGAGKTTLMRLLLRFADPDAGRILLDGHDLREYDLAALRHQIGLVHQGVLLFNGSIRDNIGYGAVGASDADIERAARLAQAHGFISALTDGYDTQVGDDGAKLSGGQRQRIALARALLKDPAVLILDEATAMFDPDGEREFIAACRQMLRKRTLLLITHRPASLALADRVLRLQDGQLVEVRSAGSVNATSLFRSAAATTPARA